MLQAGTMPAPAEQLTMVREVWQANSSDNPVDEALIAYERDAMPSQHHGSQVELRLYIRNGDDELLGGATAGTRWNALNVFSLWVDETQRGYGLGAALMDALESFALEQGCDRLLLETTTVHNYGFYRHRGFELVGHIDDHPAPGQQYYYLQRLLSPPGSDCVPGCRGG